MNTENRVSISLSQNAYKIIEMDTLSFMRASGSISGLANKIIRNSVDDSLASINIRIENERQKYIDMFQKAEARAIPQKALSLILDNHRQALLKQMTSFAKDRPLQIRLQNDTLCLLESSESLDEYVTMGAYIKALLEVYSLKSPYEREEIFFADTISILKSTLSSTKNTSRLKVFYSTSTGKNVIYEVKPYKLMADPDKQFHYLIGLSKPIKNKNAIFKPTAFRVSRISNITNYAKSHGSGRITKDEINVIKKVLNEKGPQYLMDDIRTFKVLLTPEGVNMFNSIAHMRPIPSTIESGESESKMLTFKCTDRQIRYYFFQFGGNASIIEPKDVREEFRLEYQQAFQVYK